MAGGRAAAQGGLGKLVQEALAWFITPQRKVLGAVGVALALAVVAALAALPFVFSQKTQPPTRQPANTADQPKTLEEQVAGPSDLSSAHKPAPSAAAASSPPSIAKTGPASAPPPATKPEIKPVPPTPVKPPPTPEIATAPAPNEKSPSEKANPVAPPAVTAKEIALDGLLAAIDLPPTKDSAAISLGKVESVPNPDLAVQLLGGETIAKGNPKFEAIKDGDPLSWTVRMTEKNKDDVKIATVGLEAGECKIQWTADARDRASLMRFCGLQFTSGKNKHVTVLTAPKSVPPLILDLETQVNRPRRLNREFALPDASLLRMRILPLDNSMPKYDVKLADKGHPVHGRGKSPELTGGDTIAAKGRAVLILEKDRTPKVTCPIAFDIRGKDVSLDVQATTEISGETFPFNASMIQLRSARVNGFIMASESPQGKNSRNPPSANDPGRKNRER